MERKLKSRALRLLVKKKARKTDVGNKHQRGTYNQSQSCALRAHDFVRLMTASAHARKMQKKLQHLIKHDVEERIVATQNALDVSTSIHFKREGLLHIGCELWPTFAHLE